MPSWQLGGSFARPSWMRSFLHVSRNVLQPSQGFWLSAAACCRERLQTALNVSQASPTNMATRASPARRDRRMPVARTACSRLSTMAGYQPLKSSQAWPIEQIWVPAME